MDKSRLGVEMPCVHSKELFLPLLVPQLQALGIEEVILLDQLPQLITLCRYTLPGSGDRVIESELRCQELLFGGNGFSLIRLRIRHVRRRPLRGKEQRLSLLLLVV